MTMTEFIRVLCGLAKNQPQRCLAIDFEPSPDGGLMLRFRTAGDL